MTCEFCGVDGPVIVHAFCTEGHCEDRSCVEACGSCQDWFEALGEPDPEPKKVEPKKEGRPIYEKKDDRMVQTQIIAEYCKPGGMQYKEMPPLFPYDYELMRNGKLFGIAEVKRRNVSVAEYPDIILSKNKVDSCLMQAYVKKLSFVFIVKFDDVLARCLIYSPAIGKPEEFEVRMGGRTDRGDSQDIEQVYAIPINRFEVI